VGERSSMVLAAIGAARAVAFHAPLVSPGQPLPYTCQQECAAGLDCCLGQNGAACAALVLGDAPIHAIIRRPAEIMAGVLVAWLEVKQVNAHVCSNPSW